MNYSKFNGKSVCIERQRPVLQFATQFIKSFHEPALHKITLTSNAIYATTRMPVHGQWRREQQAATKNLIVFQLINASSAFYMYSVESSTFECNLYYIWNVEMEMVWRPSPHRKHTLSHNCIFQRVRQTPLNNQWDRADSKNIDQSRRGNGNLA